MLGSKRECWTYGIVPGGINGRYRLTECPCHRQFQPLVQWPLHSDRVPFLVGVLLYRMYICSMCRLLAGMCSGWLPVLLT